MCASQPPSLKNSPGNLLGGVISFQIGLECMLTETQLCAPTVSTAEAATLLCGRGLQPLPWGKREPVRGTGHVTGKAASKRILPFGQLSKWRVCRGKHGKGAFLALWKATREHSLPAKTPSSRRTTEWGQSRTKITLGGRGWPKAPTRRGQPASHGHTHKHTHHKLWDKRQPGWLTSESKRTSTSGSLPARSEFTGM